MANIAYNDDKETSPCASNHINVIDPPKSEATRGRPRKFSSIEERDQHYKNIEYYKKYTSKYYYEKVKTPCTCEICGYNFCSMKALNAHKINNNKCKLIKKTTQFLSSEQHEKLKEVIHKDKVK